MSIPTSADFVNQWAADHGFMVEGGWSNEEGPPAFLQWAADQGFAVEPGWSTEQGPPAYVLMWDNQRTCISRGETVELAFSRMESMFQGQDPSA